MNDKTQTFEFDIAETEKPIQNRSENDEYSEARRNKEHLQKRRKEEKGNGGLIALVIILVVLLIAAIVTGIFILKAPQEAKLPADEIVIEEPENEEEVPPEVQNVTLSCNIIFYAESVISKDGSYTVLADLYDEGMFKFDNKKLTIDGETEIRQDGKRMTPRSLIYIIENSGGNRTVFEGEINEADGRILSISYSAPVEEEEVPETEGEVIEEAEIIVEEGEESIGGEVIE